MTAELVRGVLAEVRGELSGEVPDDCWTPAVELFEQVALADDFADFLTLPGLRADQVVRLMASRTSTSPTRRAPGRAADARVAAAVPG